jgi:Domain of unknown function (DUF4905)
LHKSKIKTVLERKLEFNFSHVFNGIVWNSVVSEDNQVLVLEIRDSQQKQVSFGALNVNSNSWLWQNKITEEPWWVNLNSVSSNHILLTIYTETNNPDRKGILAYDLANFTLSWWNNNFSLIGVSGNFVFGTSSAFGLREVILDIQSGKEVKGDDNKANVNFGVLRPQQYQEGSEYFNTVKIFLEKKLNLLAISSLEYLEHNGLIFISFYTQNEGLANDLIVLSAMGNIVLHEKMSDHLKGIGWDTFFILAGCVFFVRNKVELVSYKIV